MTDVDDLVSLIAQSYTVASDGQQIAAETARDVWASISSVSRSEWHSAALDGLQAELVVTTPAVNYAGEKIAEVHGVRYGVYRTYFPKESDMVELYLENKAGVTYVS